MKFKNAKIKILDLDLRGCLYLNNFSHSQRVALFFKIISRAGDGPFWYLMLAIVWGMQGITYSLQISFPSGHTLHAVMVTIVLGYIQPMLLAAMLPFMVLVALSRMVLGLHYPSDVIVGALIGAAVASLIIFVAPLLGIAL